MEWICPPTDWDNFDWWAECTAGHLFNQRVSLFYRMKDGGARFDSVAELEAQLRHAEWVFAEPIAQYVAEIMARPGDEPDLAPYPRGALSLIEYRINTIADWMRDHEVKGRRVIHYPACSHAELLNWLSGPWWEEHGRRRAAESLVQDEMYHQQGIRERLGLNLTGKRRRRRRKAAVIEVSNRGRPRKSEPDSWESLAEWLHAELAAFRGLPHFYDVLCDVGELFWDVEAVHWRMKSADSHFEAQLRPILREFAQRGRWPEEPIDPVVGALLASRIESAAGWSASHVVPAECVIAYPDISFRRLLRWLLLDWWDARGRCVAAYQFQIMRAAQRVREGKRAGAE